MFIHSCVTVFAAIPMSSTYLAHLYALMSVSKYSRIKLENADSDRLRPCAKRRYAKVQLAKLKANIWIDWESAI